MMATEITEQQTGAARGAACKCPTFELGQESYGIAVLKIRDILLLVNITRVPLLPYYIKSVIKMLLNIDGAPEAEMSSRTANV
jgi:purine-binding chemotaxis protein CheW